MTAIQKCESLCPIIIMFIVNIRGFLLFSDGECFYSLSWGVSFNCPFGAS